MLVPWCEICDCSSAQLGELDTFQSGLTRSCSEEAVILLHGQPAFCRCNGVSGTLKEQLKGHYNISQQAAIAAAVSPGQATFSLLQVRPASEPFAAASKGSHVIHQGTALRVILTSMSLERMSLGPWLFLIIEAALSNMVGSSFQSCGVYLAVSQHALEQVLTKGAALALSRVSKVLKAQGPLFLGDFANRTGHRCVQEDQ